MPPIADITSNPMLQQYAQGAAQAAVMPVADFLAPTVEVGAMQGRYWIHDKRTRFRIPDTVRSLGGPATQILLSRGKGTYDCTPHALDTPVDELELNEDVNSDSVLGLIEERADTVSAIGGLAHEKEVIDTALDSVGAGTDVAFDAATDPVKYLDEVILAVRKSAIWGSNLGIRVLIGAEPWKGIKNHPKVLGRLPSGKRSRGDLQTVRLEDFGQMLIGEPEARTSFMVYDQSEEGAAQPDYEWVLNNVILVFAAVPAPNRFDPSFMKTFRLRGYWMKLGSYTKEDGRGEVVKFDWSSDVQVANSAACTRINPSF